jgi:hypothetical protein
MSPLVWRLPRQQRSRAAVRPDTLQKQVADGCESIWLPNQRNLDGVGMGDMLRLFPLGDFTQQTIDQVVRLVEKTQCLVTQRTLMGREFCRRIYR